MGDYSDHDPNDERFPSEAHNPQLMDADQTQAEVEHPGIAYMLGFAAVMALLSCIVAGVGLAGIFIISDFLSQSIKHLSTSKPDQISRRLSSSELAEMVKKRRVELEEEMVVARKARAKEREREIREEARMLREAAISSGGFGWSWR